MVTILGLEAISNDIWKQIQLNSKHKRTLLATCALKPKEGPRLAIFACTLFASRIRSVVEVGKSFYPKILPLQELVNGEWSFQLLVL